MMKKTAFIFCLFFVGCVLADSLSFNTGAPTQPSGQASAAPNNQDAQQINQFFNKANYKFLKRYEFKPLFKVPSHD